MHSDRLVAWIGALATLSALSCSGAPQSESARVGTPNCTYYRPSLHQIDRSPLGCFAGSQATG